MKQRITVEQLQELTEEQQQKLREWWEPQDGDMFFRNNRIQICDIGYHHDKDECLPLLDIGQMIELLLDKCGKNLNIYQCKNFNTITVTTFKEYFAQELCDSLWEAVKEVL
jgi:hypothetical protein